MSNIAVQGGASGTGTFTLLAPSTSTNRTLTLPDATGTVTTSEAVAAAGYTTAAAVLTQFNASGSAPVYACRAWVNFNGTGTVAIRASGNVSSITDLNVGFYRINIATALPDANYSINVTRARSDANGGALVAGSSASSVEVRTMVSTSAASEDADYVFASIFR